MSTQYKQVVVRSEDAALLQEALRNIMHRKGLRVKMPSILVAPTTGESGGSAPLIKDTLASTLIVDEVATTSKGHIVYAPVLANGRAVEVGTSIIHQLGDDGRQWLVGTAQYSTYLALAAPIVSQQGTGIQVNVPTGANTNSVGIQWAAYYPTMTWTNISSVPSWPYIGTPNTNPAWLYVRLYSTSAASYTWYLAGPWRSVFSQGSIDPTLLFTATPSSGVATSVKVELGSWFSTLPEVRKSAYQLQTALGSVEGTVPTSWTNNTSGSVTISGTGNRYVWARLQVQDQASVSSYGGGYTTAYSTPAMLGVYTRT